MPRKLKTGNHKNCTPAQLNPLEKYKWHKGDPRAAEAGRKGGQKVQRIYKERNTFKKTTEWLLSQYAFDTQNEAVEALRKKFPDLSNQEAMTIAVIAETIRTGDPKGFTALRDTVGESPTQNVNLQNQEPLTINIKTVD